MNYLSTLALATNLAFSTGYAKPPFTLANTTQIKVFTLLTDGSTWIISEGEYEDSSISSECKVVTSANGEKVQIHIIKKSDIFSNGDSDFEEMTPNSADSENFEVFDISQEDMKLIQGAPDCKKQDQVPQGTLAASSLYS